MEQRVEEVLAIYERRLEAEHEQRRAGTLDRNHSLLAVGAATGRLIQILAGGLERPKILEIGTSFGYSTIWLAEAARVSGGRVFSMELERHKSEYAREMATRAGLDGFVEFLVGDAVALIPELPFRFDFVLLDLWKELYPACLDAFYPKLQTGAIVVADNMLGRQREGIEAYSAALRTKPGMASVILPVGSGIEVSRWMGEGS